MMPDYEDSEVYYEAFQYGYESAVLAQAMNAGAIKSIARAADDGYALGLEARSVTPPPPVKDVWDAWQADALEFGEMATQFAPDDEQWVRRRAQIILIEARQSLQQALRLTEHAYGNMEHVGQSPFDEQLSNDIETDIKSAITRIDMEVNR